MINYDGLYNKDFFGNKLNETHFSDKKLHFQIIKDGTILPHVDVEGVPIGFGGIVDGKGNFVRRSPVHVGISDAYTPNEEVLESPLSVIYIGMLFHVWGHSLTDNLKRICFLKSKTYQKFFSRLRIVYTPMEGGVTKNFARLLEILGIDLNQLNPITKPVKFKNIILPDESFFLDKGKFHIGEGNFTVDGTWDNFDGNDGSYFTREYLDTVAQLRNHVKKNFSPISQEKFYFFYGKQNAGEERLAQYFQSKGYEILRPELLPIDEQLNIFANCTSFASLVGSVSHNVIFSPDNANVILIPRRAAYLNIYQQALNHVHNIDCHYVDSALSIFAPKWDGPFCYIISENLRKYFGDDVTEKYTQEDFETFLAYVRYAKSIGLTENPQELAYLKNILPEFMEQLKNHKDLIQKFGITLN